MLNKHLRCLWEKIIILIKFLKDLNKMNNFLVFYLKLPCLF